MGGNGEGAAALWVVSAFMTPPTGCANRRTPRSTRRPPRAPRNRAGTLDGRWRVEQRPHDPPRLLNPVLPGEAQEHLARRGPLIALVGELHARCSGRGLHVSGAILPTAETIAASRS